MIKPHSFWNNPARNPTQTRYNRFLITPRRKVVSAFTESQKNFKTMKDSILKTRFTEILGDLKEKANGRNA